MHIENIEGGQIQSSAIAFQLDSRSDGRVVRGKIPEIVEGLGKRGLEVLEAPHPVHQHQRSSALQELFGLGFKLQGSGFRVWGLGFRV